MFARLRLRFVDGELRIMSADAKGMASRQTARPVPPANDAGAAASAPRGGSVAVLARRQAGGGGGAQAALPVARTGPAAPAPEAVPASVTATELALLEDHVREALRERRRLETAITTAVALRDKARRDLRRTTRSLVGRLLIWRVRRLEEQLAAAGHDLRQTTNLFASCRVDLDFELDEAALLGFRQLASAHGRLAAADAIWDIGGPDRERGGTVGIERSAVTFGHARSGIVASAWPGLGLTDATGVHIDLFPGIYIRRGATGANVTVGDLRDLSLDFATVRFAEDQDAPADAVMAAGGARGPTADAEAPDAGPAGPPGHARPRRLPILRYGRLHLRGPGGIDRAFLVSDHDAAEAFAQAFARFRADLDDLARRSREGPITPGRVAPPGGSGSNPEMLLVPAGMGLEEEERPAPMAAPPARPPRRRRGVAALIVLVLGAGLAAAIALTWSDGSPERTVGASGQLIETGPPPPPAAQGSPPAAVPRATEATPPAAAPRIDSPPMGGAVTSIPTTPAPTAAPVPPPPPPSAPEPAAVDLPLPPPAAPPPPSEAPPPPEPASATTPGDWLTMALPSNVRAAPDGSATVLRTVSAGVRVRIFARYANWLQVGDEEQPWGWVHLSRARGDTGQ